jgi:hypothetical protein
MAIYLNNNARDLLELAQLAPDQEERIATYMIKYGKPRGPCFKKIAWLAYRIWNAIKALFGISDWQRAMTLVKNKVYEAAKDVHVLGDQGSYREFVESKATQFASDLLERTLGLHEATEDEDGFVPDTSENEKLQDVIAQISPRTLQ